MITKTQTPAEINVRNTTAKTIDLECVIAGREMRFTIPVDFYNFPFGEHRFVMGYQGDFSPADAPFLFNKHNDGHRFTLNDACATASWQAASEFFKLKEAM